MRWSFCQCKRLINFFFLFNLTILHPDTYFSYTCTTAHNGPVLFESLSSGLHLNEAHGSSDHNKLIMQWSAHLLLCGADRVRAEYPAIREGHSCSIPLSLSLSLSLPLWVYETMMNLFFPTHFLLPVSVIPPLYRSGPLLLQIDCRCSGKSFSLQTCAAELLTSHIKGIHQPDLEARRLLYH